MSGGSRLPRKRLLSEYTLEEQRLLVRAALEGAVRRAVERGLMPRKIVVRAPLLLRILGLPDVPVNRSGAINIVKEMRGLRLEAGGASWVVKMRLKRKGRGPHLRWIHVLVIEREG